MYGANRTGQSKRNLLYREAKAAAALVAELRVRRYLREIAVMVTPVRIESASNILGVERCKSRIDATERVERDDSTIQEYRNEKPYLRCCITTTTTITKKGKKDERATSNLKDWMYHQDHKTERQVTPRPKKKKKKRNIPTPIGLNGYTNKFRKKKQNKSVKANKGKKNVPSPIGMPGYPHRTPIGTGCWPAPAACL